MKCVNYKKVLVIKMSQSNNEKLSFIIPAKDESLSIAAVVASIRSSWPDAEVIVVNDGSSDDTEMLAISAGARVINHPYSKGNGASIKTGARAATGGVLVFMDGDGQHDPADADRLLATLAAG